MRLLFDTHALLWLLRGDERLPGRVRETVLSADELSFSTVTLWEIGLKLSRSGFDFEMFTNWQTVIPAKCELFGVRHLGIEASHCRAIQDLPFHHKDPFDRMLIAQARVEGLAILTRDPQFREYEVEVIW